MRKLGMTIAALAAAAPWAQVRATPHTPLAWQRRVDVHSNPAFLRQAKHVSWIRDRNRNFIDDEIEARFKAGDRIDVVVDLNRCYPPGTIRELLARYGKVAYVGQTVTFAILEGVKVADLKALAERPEVAMIEWRAPDMPELDVASRAIQARRSTTYPGQSAEELGPPGGLTGQGVNIAIVDAGVDDGTGAYTQLAAGRFVAGYDATDPSDPGDGTRNPGPAGTGNHGSAMALFALGAAAPGHTCRAPGAGLPGECRGIAPRAGLVDVKMCDTSACQPEKAFDWIAAHARQFNIRVVEYAYTRCGDSDGTDALSQQVNYLVATGLVFVASHGNASTQCNGAGLPAGTRIVKAPGAASLAITVAGSDDAGTIDRGNDGLMADRLVGPRLDFNLATPEPLALKPDLAAPGTNMTFYKSGTTIYTGVGGTSPASAIVAGAAALILERYPQMQPETVKQLLLDRADRSRSTPYYASPATQAPWDAALGWGLLDVGGALQAASTASNDLRFPSCRTPSPTGAGQLCELQTGRPAWDNEDDVLTGPLQVNVASTITARVENAGAQPAAALVTFGVYEFGAGSPQFRVVGSKQVIVPAQGILPVSIDWTPTSAGHQCAQVSIAYGLDSELTNNLTQRNLQVAASRYRLHVETPFQGPARFEVVARADRPGWKCQVARPTFDLGGFSSCGQDVEVRFDAPPGTPPGQQANCQVEVRAVAGDGKAKVLGGVAVRTYVPRPCRTWGRLEDGAGKPIDGARVVLEPTRIPGAPAGKQPRPLDAKPSLTGEEGVFSARVVPGVPNRLVVEAGKWGRGAVLVRPECGLGLPALVLDKGGLRTRPEEAALAAEEAKAAE